MGGICAVRPMGWMFTAGLNFGTNDVLSNGANNLLFAASAGDVTLARFLKSGGGDSNLTFKASNSIIGNTATISSTSGKVNTVLWSDSDASNAGAISSFLGQMPTTTGTSRCGGLDNGANGGTAGDNIPDNYAWGTSANVKGLPLAMEFGVQEEEMSFFKATDRTMSQ